MKTTTWMTVAMAGLYLLPACGGEELSEMDSRMASPAAENLAQKSNDLTVTGTIFSLTPHGGSGGSITNTQCPSGYVAVGIHGRSLAYIDRLGLGCRYLNADGSLGNTYYRAGAEGGFGGADFDIRCPDGQAVVGFYGNSAGYVDRLGLICSTPSNWRDFGSVQSYTGSTGGTGGSYFHETCPGSYVVTALNLHVGSFVDWKQTVCSYIQ